MRIDLRTLGIILLSISTVMLFEQCCTCGDQIAPATEEEASEAETSEEVAEEEIADERPADAKAKAKPIADAPKTVLSKEEAEAKKQKPLSVTITNLKSATAPVIFSVYDNADTYLDPKAQLKTYRFVPTATTLKLKLTDLPYGTYAIAFYQDMNDSGDIDKNGLGIPKEPYAFSNDIRPKMSAPSFADCKFIYSKKENSIEVKMGK